MRLVVTSTPHTRSKDTIEQTMREVLLALAPATIMAVYYFGLRALLIILLTMAASVAFEWLYQKITKQTITALDGSAAVTGVLLAFNLPVSSPFWMPIVGSFFAIVIAKQLFGGLGQNFLNPALAARAFLMAAYTPLMASRFTAPARNLFSLSVDAVSVATPLTQMRESPFIPAAGDILNAFLGNTAGCLGETCALALIIGGVYLLIRRIITWHIPVVYTATVFLLSVFLGRSGLMTGNGLFEIFSGGVMMGAFFMVTDYATSPVNDLGKIIMALGCGVLTVVIRFYGGYPEGVSYSILLMNLFVPLLDKYCAPRVFGVKKKGGAQNA
ncbi:MAG: RnfABCDGE type electron transport complex subunit D [Peptococcaceae bacterium]|jgi:electron transport complex protein RnfD|nr:RnfABCDGE type electron transport complex subunit D [Peptococcaceae bacterium]